MNNYLVAMIADTMGLSLGPLAGTFVSILLVYQYIIFPSFLSPLSHMPNAHWSSPYSRIWILSVRWNNRENKTLHAIHRRLGPVIRLGPNELSISNTDSLRNVYQGGFDKPIWYSVFDNYG